MIRDFNSSFVNVANAPALRRGIRHNAIPGMRYRMVQPWARHLAAVASPIDRPEVDVRERSGRRGVLSEIGQLVVRIASENPTWGYTRIQGALKNVGHCCGETSVERLRR